MGLGMKIDYDFQSEDLLQHFLKDFKRVKDNSLFEHSVKAEGSTLGSMSYRMFESQSDDENDVYELLKLNMFMHVYSRYEVAHHGFK